MARAVKFSFEDVLSEVEGSHCLIGCCLGSNDDLPGMQFAEIYICCGVHPDACGSFRIMTFIGCENGAGCVQVEVLSRTDLGVLCSGVGGG